MWDGGACRLRRLGKDKKKCRVGDEETGNRKAASWEEQVEVEEE